MDDGEEIIDIFDDLGRHIGTKSRAAVHRDGDWHQVFNCLVVRLDGQEPAVLLQLRGTASGAFPNLLDLTVGGHLLAGEPPLMGGFREFQEELGVEVRPEGVVFLGVRRNVLVDSGSIVHRELIQAFLVLDDRPLETYRLPAGEVGGLFECSLAGLLTALDAPPKSFEGNGIAIGENGTMRSSRRAFTKADLVPNDAYWITILIMAERLALGRRPLAISACGEELGSDDDIRVIRAVVLDVGGVVASWVPGTNVDAAWETRLGLASGSIAERVWNLPSQTAAELGVISVEEFWREVAAALNLTEREAENLYEDCWSSTYQDDRVGAWIRSLRPRYRVASLSNSWSDGRRQCIKRLGLDQLVDLMVFSAEEGVAKPDLEIYRRTLKRLEVEPGEALFIDDRIENIEAAASLGLQVLHSTTPDHLVREAPAILKSFA